ncbi:hypothetical protein ACVII1_007125 [Bradyrhizobium elkanii]
MSDNFDVTPGSGKTVATDDVGGIHYQRVKGVWGPDGTANDIDTAAGKPLPVQSLPQTSGGLSRSRTLIPNNTTAIVVKSGAGQLYKVRATNNSATIAYIKNLRCDERDGRLRNASRHDHDPCEHIWRGRRRHD